MFQKSGTLVLYIGNRQYIAEQMAEVQLQKDENALCHPQDVEISDSFHMYIFTLIISCILILG